MMRRNDTPSAPLTRRAWFEACLRPLHAAASPGSATVDSSPVVTARVEGPALPITGAPRTAATGTRVAVIAGRHCLAYQQSFCTTCSERCPVEGAIVIEGGLPRVRADRCTGCEICHQVCPAPENAVLLVPRRTAGSAPRR